MAVHHSGGRRAPPRRRASTPTSRAWPAPATSTAIGPARPEDGVVSLALGLGKTIVDGRPLLDLLAGAGRELRLPCLAGGAAGADADGVLGRQHGPAAGLRSHRRDRVPRAAGLAEAEADGDTGAARLDLRPARRPPSSPGHRADRPARAELRAAPACTRRCPSTTASEALLAVFEEALGTDGRDRVRPDLPPPEEAASSRASCRCGRWPVSQQAGRDRRPEELRVHGVLVASDRVMGNGVATDIRDVVYVKPARPSRRATRRATSRRESGR